MLCVVSGAVSAAGAPRGLAPAVGDFDEAVSFAGRLHAGLCGSGICASRCAKPCLGRYQSWGFQGMARGPNTYNCLPAVFGHAGKERDYPEITGVYGELTFGGGVRFLRRLGVGVHFAGFAADQGLGVTVSAPHPVLPNRTATDRRVTDPLEVRQRGHGHRPGVFSAADVVNHTQGIRWPDRLCRGGGAPEDGRIRAARVVAGPRGHHHIERDRNGRRLGMGLPCRRRRELLLHSTFRRGWGRYNCSTDRRR